MCKLTSFQMNWDNLWRDHAVWLTEIHVTTIIAVNTNTIFKLEG